MITDSFFQQGVTHEVCEDYALHGPNYFVLSDGCSNGGGPRIDTDWGARLLCKAAEDELANVPHDNDWDWFMNRVGEEAIGYVKPIPNLNTSCLTATLLAAVAFEDKVSVFLMGDGVYGGKRKNGNWEIHLIQFENSAPYYLKYHMTPGDKDRYFRDFTGTFVRTTYTGDLMDKTKERWDAVIRLGKIDPEKPYFVHEFPVTDFEMVFGTTDGSSSFYKQVNTGTSKHNDPVSAIDALRALLDVNNIRPGILRLQRQWCWKQNRPGTFQRLGWHNADDIAVGLIRP
jgi:hypothetical protein